MSRFYHHIARPSITIVAGVLIGMFVAAALFVVPLRRGTTTIRVFNIGQGDAILVETPQYKRILVDGGPGHATLTALGTVIPLWSNRIDAIVPTHPDADHIGGLIEVLDRYNVGQVLATGVVHQTETTKQFLGGIQTHAYPLLSTKQGMSWELDGVRFDVLYPPDPPIGAVIQQSNTEAIILKVTANHHCALLTSDIAAQEEAALLSWAHEHNVSLDCDYLKVTHHGSKYGTSAEFLGAVTPKEAAISVGKNSYGHPDGDTIKRLETSGAKVKRTDKNGTITWKL